MYSTRHEPCEYDTDANLEDPSSKPARRKFPTPRAPRCFERPAVRSQFNPHSPPSTPYLHPRYPSTPTRFPIPAPPASILALTHFPFPLAHLPSLAATATAPPTEPRRLHPSTSTWPRFSRSRHARSRHSISDLPRIRAKVRGMPRARPTDAPVPVLRNAEDGREKRCRTRELVRPRSAPVWKLRCVTCVVRIVRAWGWCSA